MKNYLQTILINTKFKGIIMSLLLAHSAPAAVIFSAVDFINVPTGPGGIYTEATSAFNPSTHNFNTIYGWGVSVPTATGGNPDSYLTLAAEAFNSSIWIAVDLSEETASEYTFSFDYRIGSAWSANDRGFEIIGVIDNTPVTAMGVPTRNQTAGGTLLESQTLPITTTWTNVSHTISIPSEYDTVILKIMRNGNNTAPSLTNGIDNIMITAVPEPSTYAAGIAVLALVLIRLRRRNA